MQFRHRVAKLQNVQCRTATAMYWNRPVVSYPTQLQRYDTKQKQNQKTRASHPETTKPSAV